MKTHELKQMAREAGADLVGVAPAARWADWPAAQNPRTLLPTCRSVIVIGRRVLRGAFRGVEEGTNFSSTYGIFGMNWNEHDFLSRTVQQVACASCMSKSMHFFSQASRHLPQAMGFCPRHSDRAIT